MTKVSVHPSTLEGIKRLDKTTKRDRQLTHAQALAQAALTAQAAQAAGCENFKHARHQLADVNVSTVGPRHDQILKPQHLVEDTTRWPLAR